MSEFKFVSKPAKKVQVPVLIALWSKSGGGKTYSAIVLARGIVGPKGKIFVIDTENERSLFYAELAGGWEHVRFDPPFTPERYAAAFKYCEDNGADIIIVDSMSHVWDGEGGTLEAADEKGGNGLSKFKAPKIAHKRLVNKLTRSKLPVIFCIRAKDAVKQVGGGSDMKIIPLGWQPIAEKNFIFEMTLDLHMTKDGKFDLETSKTVPGALRDAVKAGAVVNEAMGAAIARWAGSGAPMDVAAIKAKQEAIIEEEIPLEEPPQLETDGLDAANKGVKSYTAWLSKLTPAQKDTIKSNHSAWSKLAKSIRE